VRRPDPAPPRASGMAGDPAIPQSSRLRRAGSLQRRAERSSPVSFLSPISIWTAAFFVLMTGAQPPCHLRYLYAGTRSLSRFRPLVRITLREIRRVRWVISAASGSAFCLRCGDRFSIRTHWTLLPSSHYQGRAARFSSTAFPAACAMSLSPLQDALRAILHCRSQGTGQRPGTRQNTSASGGQDFEVSKTASNVFVLLGTIPLRVSSARSQPRDNCRQDRRPYRPPCHSPAH